MEKRIQLFLSKVLKLWKVLKFCKIQTFTDIKKFYFRTKFTLASEIVISSLQRPSKIWSTILFGRYIRFRMERHEKCFTLRKSSINQRERIVLYYRNFREKRFNHGGFNSEKNFSMSVVTFEFVSVEKEGYVNSPIRCTM